MRVNNKYKNVIVIISIVMVIIMIMFIFEELSLEFDSSNFNYDEDVFMNNDTDLENQEIINIGNYLYDKANEIYEVSTLRPYCDHSIYDINKMITTDFNFGNDIKYYESNYEDLKSLKNKLRDVLSDDLIEKLVDDKSLTLDYRKVKKNKNYDYIIKDNILYCRAHTLKGWLSSYLNYYNIKVKSISFNKIIYSVRSYFANEIGIDDPNCLGATVININNCKKSEIEYEDMKFVIEKNKEKKWVVSEFTFHG